MIASSVRVASRPSSLLEALAQREPEAVALLRRLAEVGLRLGLLRLREGLGVREPDSPAALLDCGHEHLDLGSRRERPADIGATGNAQLGVRVQPDLARA